jgi:hypothetical protein
MDDCDSDAGCTNCFQALCDDRFDSLGVLLDRSG